MSQAATALREPELKPVPDLDATLANGKNRDDPDFWKMKDGAQRQDAKFVQPKKKKGAGFFLAMLVAISAAGGALYYLKTHGLPIGKPKPAAMVAPGAALPGPLETSVPPLATPTRSDEKDSPVVLPSPAKVGATTVAPRASHNMAQTPAVTPVPVDTAQNFAAIKVVEARLDDLSKQVGTLADDIKTLIAGHAQSKEQLAQLTERARNTPAPVVAAIRPVAPRNQVARAAPPKPAQLATVNPAVGSTNLVSVDLWNGTPSVAISEGGSVRFMTPGDVTAQGLTVKNADPVTQQVTFGLPSGEEVVARVDTRK